MPLSITSVAVDNTQYVRLVAHIRTKQVIVSEDPSVANWPTTDLLFAASGSPVFARRVPGGLEKRFTKDSGRGWYNPGDEIAWVKTVGGATTLFQEEEPTV
jgi:hypothetical protein